MASDRAGSSRTKAYKPKAHIDRIGAAKVGTYADWHFTWSKSSLISRLLGKDVKRAIGHSHR